METNIPQQKLPLRKKTDDWKKQCVEAYINLSTSSTSERRDFLRSLYDYYNGVIDSEDYNYVLKPYGKTRKNFPSKMRNYPIIKPIIDLLLGEKAKRPFNYTVGVQNSDSIAIKEQAKQDLIYSNLEMQFAQKAAEAGMGPDPLDEGQEVQLPEHIAAQFEDSYVDNRAIKGQSAMNYIQQYCEVRHKLNKAWFHYLISGEVYTMRGVRSSEPFYEVLNPVDVDYDKDPDLEFVEDGDWALVRKFVHASTVIDHYYDELTEEQTLNLETPLQQSDTSYLYLDQTQDPNRSRNRLIEVVNVFWKSRKRIGFLTFVDPETGMIEELDVDESFRMPKELKEIGAKIDWQWVNEVWEGTRIDGQVYVKMRPLVNQRASLDNPSKCKLPINGRRYSDINSTNVSLVSLGIPYQLNYNIYKYRLELSIAKSKDIIAQFDINMIPKKWDLDKFMYYVEGTGIAWVDYNKEGIKLSPQHQSVLDMSVKTIEQYIVLLNSIMEEWEKLSGVNRQRQGNVGAYEGKAASQQAIVQSSHITEDLFRKFSHLEQRDLQALLDYSKEAWHTGKKGMYVMPDGTTEFLDIDSVGHMESEYGIFMTDSGKEQDKIQAVQGLAQSMMQNGVPASTIVDMVDSDNFVKIKSNIKKAEAQMQQLEQAQSEAQQAMEQAKLEAEQAKVQNENMNKEKDRENKIEVAKIQAEATTYTAELNLEKGLKDLEMKDQEISLKEKDLTETSRANRASENTKRADTKVKEKAINQSKKETK